MATPIDNAIVMQFSDQFDHAFQQRVPRLRRYTRLRTGVVGNQTQFNIMGESSMVEITGMRHSLTPWIDIASQSRWASKRDFNHPVMLDWADKPEVLIDLEQGYAMAGAMAAARTADTIILGAVTGTAYSGVNGATANAFNTSAITISGAQAGTAGNLVAAGGTGLTVAKVRTVRGIFDAREVGVDDYNAGVRNAFVWVVNAGAMQQLMSETTATSGDFVADKPLTEGSVHHFMGFDFVIHNGLTNTTGTTYRTVVWHRLAMGFALWRERDLFVDRLPEHNNSTGVSYMMSMGAVRIHDKGVLAVDVVL
jgi:hypothetical protein